MSTETTRGPSAPSREPLAGMPSAAVAEFLDLLARLIAQEHHRCAADPSKAGTTKGQAEALAPTRRPKAGDRPGRLVSSPTSTTTSAKS